MSDVHDHHHQRGAAVGYALTTKYMYGFMFLLMILLAYQLLYSYVGHCDAYTDCYSCTSSVCRWYSDLQVCGDVPYREYKSVTPEDSVSAGLHFVSLRQQCPASVECGERGFFLSLFYDPLFCQHPWLETYYSAIICLTLSLGVMCVFVLFWFRNSSITSAKGVECVSLLSEEVRHMYTFCSYCALLWKEEPFIQMQNTHEYDVDQEKEMDDVIELSQPSPIGKNLKVCPCPSHQSLFLTRKCAWMALSFAFPNVFVFFCHTLALPLSLILFSLFSIHFVRMIYFIFFFGRANVSYAKPFTGSHTLVEQHQDIATIAHLSFPPNSVNEVVEIGQVEDRQSPYGPIHWWEEESSFFQTLLGERALFLQVLFYDPSFYFITLFLVYTIGLEALHLTAIFRKWRSNQPKGGWEIAPAPAHRYSVLTRESILLIDRSYTSLSVVTVPLPCSDLFISTRTNFEAEVGRHMTVQSLLSNLPRMLFSLQSTFRSLPTTPVSFHFAPKAKDPNDDRNPAYEMAPILSFFTEYPYDHQLSSPISFRSIIEESEMCTDSLAGHTLFSFPSIEVCRSVLDDYWVFTEKEKKEEETGAFFKGLNAFFYFLFVVLMLAWSCFPLLCWSRWESTHIWLFLLFAIELVVYLVVIWMALILLGNDMFCCGNPSPANYNVSLKTKESSSSSSMFDTFSLSECVPEKE